MYTCLCLIIKDVMLNIVHVLVFVQNPEKRRKS